MNIPASFDIEFKKLLDILVRQYGKTVFDLDGIGSQLDIIKFSDKFFTNKTTVADVSIDGNANVTDNGVVAYTTELVKPFERLNSYYQMWKVAKEEFDLQTANDMVIANLLGDIYINDFHGLGAGKPYCFNYSTYDIMTRGLSTVDKIKSLPPKYLYAFKSQVEQFITIASNSTLGATGLADLLIVMAFYVEDILENGYKDAHFHFASEGDVWAYVRENIISMIYTLNQPMRGNQCVTEDTEVLTPKGFKKYDELKVGDKIYTWDNGKLNIQDVERVNVYDYDGDMHEYSGRDTIQVVTPNHRVLYKRNNSSEYDLKPSSELINLKTPLTYPVAMLEDDREDFNISDEMLKLCVYILADGSIDNEKRGRVSIFKSPNRWGNDELIRILDKLELKYRHHVKPSNFNGELNHYDINTESSQEVLELLNFTKEELPEWFTKLSRRQANLVIDLWAKLDGHTEEENYNKQKCQCDNYKVADQLQHVCFLAGRGSNITSRVIGDNKQETIYLIPYNRVNKSASNKQVIQYKGKVWCPTTQDGVVVFRKDGKIFISGNSPFTNVSIYDNEFLVNLVEDYIHPRKGTPVNLDVVKKLQLLYIDIMNEELERTPVTFPVTSACLSIDDDGNILDRDFLNVIAEKNLKFGFINMYLGKSSTLSSCCFDGSQKTLSKSSSGVNYMTFEELYNSKWEEYKRNFTIYHNGSWVGGKLVKLDGRHMYKIVTSNNKEIYVTDNHINPTLRGDVETKDLKEDDFLLFSNIALDSYPEKDLGLTYEQGVLVGAYLGDGSIYERKDNDGVTVNFSLNNTKLKELLLMLEKALLDSNINVSVNINKPQNNCYPININSRELSNFIRKWVGGDYCWNKELNLDCLLQSLEFRQGILDGLYLTDGGNSNRIYTTSQKLSEQLEVLITSLGMNSIIDVSDRTGEKVVIRDSEFNRQHPLYCIRWYSAKNKRSMKDIYVVRNNSIYFKIKSVSKIEGKPKDVYCFEMRNVDEPYFTLPNGMITHNCRLRSDMTNDYFNSFGAGSTKIGSLGVVTINYARLGYRFKGCHHSYLQEVERLVTLGFKINHVKRLIVAKRIAEGYHPLYTEGYLDINKQYLTSGVNGFNETIELMGYDPVSDEGVSFGTALLDKINEVNDKLGAEYGVPVNTEQVPAENVSIKLAQKDKLLGFNKGEYELYSNQFIPLTTKADMLDRIKLQGIYDKHFSGGSILHLNIETPITDKQFIIDLLDTCAKMGVVYVAINYNLQMCENGHMDVGRREVCVKCGGRITDNFTRVVGFLTNVKNWAEVRREVDYPNREFYKI